jgi:Glycosyl hydrolases family 2, TIM barrel domain/Glycosyl hydrolases family 2, sugar binding domain/Glycosyl hydrolases family 2
VTRARASLDGTWLFWPDLAAALSGTPGETRFVPRRARDARLGPARPIMVPGSWQAQFEDLRQWSGVAFYERAFGVPIGWAGLVIRACFGAVDYHCTVWVNEQAAGGHEGGYLPFDVDVSDLVRPGERNTMTLRVIDPGPIESVVGGFHFPEIPHGKQSWYGPLGGPWQSAFLEAGGIPWVRRAAVSPDPATGRVAVQTDLGAPAAGGETITHRVVSPSGGDVLSTTEDLEGGCTRTHATIAVPSPQLWDVEAPRLYSLDVTVSDAHGRSVDAWSDTFGFRTIETRAGQLLLNGRPFYLRGALDQDYYLGTIGTPPSDDVLRDNILRAKELGLNALRCHIKVPDPRYLYWADRLGMIVWAELPNWGVLTEGSKRRARATMEGSIRRDSNHPCIAIWTIVNESWGVDLVGDPDHRRWLREMYDWVKGLDPTRLVVDNSACPPNFHLATDVNDIHFYRALPDHYDEWTGLTRAWAAEPGSSFSPHGDAARAGDEPQIVSEFGNWGLPDVRRLKDPAGGDPWWFDTGGDRMEADVLVEGVPGRVAEGIVVPRGVESRFADWGLDAVFGSWDDFVRASQQHQFDGLKLEVEDIRRHPTIAGYVVTELSDCHWECNGLLDMSRRPKACHHKFASINAADVVVPLPRRRRHRTSDEAVVAVIVSHYSEEPLDRLTVSWSSPELGVSGEMHAGAPARGAVIDVGEIVFEVPAVARAERAHLRLVLVNRFGAAVARNEVELLIYPAEQAPPPAGVVIAPGWDERIARHVRAGGRAVVVATRPDALADDVRLTLRARRGTAWDGDWAQGMGWLRPQLTAGTPLRPRVDMSWIGLTPEIVVEGYVARNNADMLAGLYVGWVRAPVATIGAFRHGAGAGIVCTLPLLDRRDDPLAAALLGRLAELVADPAFSPATEL